MHSLLLSSSIPLHSTCYVEAQRGHWPKSCEYSWARSLTHIEVINAYIQHRASEYVSWSIPSTTEHPLRYGWLHYKVSFTIGIWHFCCTKLALVIWMAPFSYFYFKFSWSEAIQNLMNLFVYLQSTYYRLQIGPICTADCSAQLEFEQFKQKFASVSSS